MIPPMGGGVVAGIIGELGCRQQKSHFFEANRPQPELSWRSVRVQTEVAMRKSPQVRWLHSLRRLGLADAAEVGDGGLLTRYVQNRDEAAFEAILMRHGNMVLRVCRRHLENGADAEDAFQAVFL